MSIRSQQRYADPFDSYFYRTAEFVQNAEEFQKSKEKEDYEALETYGDGWDPDFVSSRIPHCLC